MGGVLCVCCRNGEWSYFSTHCAATYDNLIQCNGECATKCSAAGLQNPQCQNRAQYLIGQRHRSRRSELGEWRRWRGLVFGSLRPASVQSFCFFLLAEFADALMTYRLASGRLDLTVQCQSSSW